MTLTGDVLTIVIDYCGSESEEERSESMASLQKILPDYAPWVKIVQISVHAGISPENSHSTYVTQIQDMKLIVHQVNKWKKVEQVRVRTLLENYNFPQMKLAAAMYGLRKELEWHFSYVVNGGEPVTVSARANTMQKLLGVWKRDFQ